MTGQYDIKALQERAKELFCLYQTEDYLRDLRAPLEEVMANVAQTIRNGWQHPDLCTVRITCGDLVVETEGFVESHWMLSAHREYDPETNCAIEISYPSWDEDESPFLPEEQRLLETIADRLSYTLLQRENLVLMPSSASVSNPQSDWRVIINLLMKSDPDQYQRIARKMMNQLSALGIEEARTLLANFGEHSNRKDEDNVYDTNRPSYRENKQQLNRLIRKAFDIASHYLSDSEIFNHIQTWMQGEKISFLVQALENMSFSLNTIQEALHRYHNLNLDSIDLPQPTRDNIIVLLLLRFFTDQLEFINISKHHLDIDDFVDLVRKIIFPSNSYGKLGGKSAGLFLSYHILQRVQDNKLHLKNVKMPKTRYLLSDALHQFLNFNELNELIEQKYKSIEQIRDEYPNIVQVFKNSNFPPNIVSGLALVLDEFGNKPIIVRSSSLLEDRVGAVFSGKYKSLFLANQGSKEERLAALLDAIAEVYASTFGPDPVEYRKERGLLDFHEEMAVIIQEVVGTQVGDYWLPAFAGVAFSNNEFRWSPRIQRKNGLLRLVPGLGTRAVDRVSDDFSILVSPGQPNLRVNLSNDEILRYSPHKIDVINLKTNTFETVDFADLFKRFGSEYPYLDKIVSYYEDGNIVSKPIISIDFEHDTPVVTFDGLIGKTDFMPRLKNILDELEAAMGVPVDIEYAFDGTDLYILQCRAQSSSPENQPAAIPKDLPAQNILFTANKFVSNGLIQNITHVVLVDPDKYAALGSVEEMKQVGRIVGRLNKILPKRKFILMGPGRWGSRGDIKLGVSVTYSDINSSAMLIEIARKKGNYTPDVSFGTHFFQDLVEAGIRYLPLYPDEENVVFNEQFMQNADNILTQLLPEAAEFSSVIKVIDINQATGGKHLTIRMNGDLDEAVAYFTDVSSKEAELVGLEEEERAEEKHWAWRLRMAERIAHDAEREKFGIKAMYVIGSVKNANAGPASDIDLIVHTDGDPEKRKLLDLWLQGWSQCLAEMNFLRTGYRSNGLLDVHYITDQDIKEKTSFAAKINAVTDAARLLNAQN
ncbi:MAG TPA: PEP/pyruvate-binding domain-containing protein [Candidatus Cloacimonadota bacterium]|nr:PEP/pyruvate-binding domain-containing protein [Candidatus Cloacimonadota bacterium]HQL14435.1 PEP/pyruvate-binding domain-containing protein [Candidatus Cloacimonadota bacterium]